MRIKIKFILFIFFGALFLTSSFAQTKRALIVGIDKYKPTDPNAKTLRTIWSDLDGCVNDAMSIRDIIKSRFGFKDENITTLFDSTGTVAPKANILAAIKKLTDETKAGDVVFFYYAGHGSRVKNSLSPEMDKRDETIVPSDAWQTTKTDFREIRDKEIAKMLQKLADKKAIQTWIFDSCHSGSIARGIDKTETYKSRYLQPLDMIDVADPNPSPIPETDSGVLVLSAAQDFQTAKEYRDENGTPHGAFTAAFLKVLRSSPVNVSAETIFKRVKAIMQSNGSSQEPVIAGTDKRRKENLLGIDMGDVSGKTVISILKNSSGEITLQGGYALGVTPGCELVKVKTNENTATVRIKVTSVEGLNKSSVEIIEGSITNIEAGDLFVIDKWTSSGSANLYVWMPESDIQTNDLQSIAVELLKLKSDKNITWVNDPTVTDPDYEIYYRNNSWHLKNLAIKKSELLKSKPTAAFVKKLIKGKAKLFVNLPPSKKLYEDIKQKLGDPASTVVISDAKSANYFLTGKISNGKIEYAYVIPGISINDTTYKSSLPIRTDWLEYPSKTENSYPQKLIDFAYKLGQIRAWLTLDAPPDDGSFPYKLVVKNSRTGEVVRDGKLYQNQVYGFALELDSLLLKSWDRESRWIYVFGIDKDGNSTLLFPRTASSVENKMPPNQYPFPTEIQIGPKSLFRIVPPFGFDTYIMLTSADAIPDPTVFNSTGVRTREASRGGSPLSSLLRNVGSSTRGPAPVVPTTWSIERSIIQSVPKE